MPNAQGACGIRLWVWFFFLSLYLLGPWCTPEYILMFIELLKPVRFYSPLHRAGGTSKASQHCSSPMEPIRVYNPFTQLVGPVTFYKPV